MQFTTENTMMEKKVGFASKTLLENTLYSSSVQFL